jgi:hypothetical protein
MNKAVSIRRQAAKQPFDANTNYMQLQANIRDAMRVTNHDHNDPQAQVRYFQYHMKGTKQQVNAYAAWLNKQLGR